MSCTWAEKTGFAASPEAAKQREAPCTATRGAARDAAGAQACLPPASRATRPGTPHPPGRRRAQLLLASAAEASPGLATGSLVNSLVYLLGIKVLLRGLTAEGVLSSWFLGTLAYAAFGAGGYAVVCIYFIVGSLVTKVKLEQKQREGIAEARSGRRSVVSGGVAQRAQRGRRAGAGLRSPHTPPRRACRGACSAPDSRASCVQPWRWPPATWPSGG